MDTEILETNEIIIPNELLDYLKEDEKALETYNNRINSIISKEEDLEKEKEAKEREFDSRLEEFKNVLEKEKEEQAKIFSDRENELLKEKEQIDSIKSEQELKKQTYISSLLNIKESYSSKISYIKDAIEACANNDSLKKALEEEQEKMEEELTRESENRKIEINNALESIGEKKEEVVVEPIVNEIPIVEEIPTEVPNIVIDMPNINEVVSHEPREDVVNVIYGSKEVMEEHVFPYLNGLIGE